MFGKKNKTKVKVKTAKGGGPIKKVKAVIGVGVVLSAMKWLGVDDMLPPELVKAVAEFGVELISLTVALVAYYVRPDEGDGVEVDA